MDADQREFLVSHLENSGRVVENAIQGLDPDQWFAEPGPERWSVGQCAEHIVSVESRIAGLLNRMPEMPDEPSDEAEGAQKDVLVQRVATRETRVQAPPALHPESKYKTADDFLEGFRESHSKLQRVASENPAWLRRRFQEHPILKKLDGYQWLLAASCHTLRHAAQIEEVKELLASAQAG